MSTMNALFIDHFVTKVLRGEILFELADRGTWDYEQCVGSAAIPYSEVPQEMRVPREP